tara:strand:- start:119 stop:562 length:444 start_codon:yes stop_codon:yes gene_type:complete
MQFLKIILLITLFFTGFYLFAENSKSQKNESLWPARISALNERAMDAAPDSICRGYKIPKAQVSYMKKKKGCKIRGPFQGEIQTNAIDKKGTQSLEKALAECIKQKCAGISADWYIDGTWVMHKKLSRGGFRTNESSYGCTFLLTSC